MSEIESARVTVLGAGTMGIGIAEICARSGFSTTLSDMSEELAKRGLERIAQSLRRAAEKGKLGTGEAEAALSRISISPDWDPAAQTWIIEAVPEDLGLKQRLLGDLSRRAQSSFLASNTSSLSLSKIASACENPARVIGLHFFNPAPIMPLIEIVCADQTEEATKQAALDLVKRLGKQSITVRDAPGFATSRLGIVLGLEAIRMLEAGVASAEDIDRAMELGYRHPMGPLKLTDLVGLDVRLAIAEYLETEIGPQFHPPTLLRRLVSEGKLGKKSGEGFYLWEGNEAKPK